MNTIYQDTILDIQRDTYEYTLMSTYIQPYIHVKIVLVATYIIRLTWNPREVRYFYQHDTR